MSTKKKAERRVKLEISPEVEAGSYSNAATVFHGESEFILDFGMALPGKDTVRILKRVITSPKHAKQLLLALKENIDRYEKRYGVIQAAAPQMPSPRDGEPVN